MLKTPPTVLDRFLGSDFTMAAEPGEIRCEYADKLKQVCFRRDLMMTAMSFIVLRGEQFFPEPRHSLMRTLSRAGTEKS
jgi:hypothetical protein